MAKLVHVSLLIALLCVASCAPPPQKQDVDQYVKQFENVRKGVEDSIMKALPTSEEFTNMLVNASKNFASAVESAAKNLNVHVDENKDLFNNMVETASKGIESSIEFLKKLAGDDVTKKGEEVKRTIQTHVDNILANGKKIEEAVKPQWDQAQETFLSYANAFFKDLTDAGERLKSDIDKALQPSSGKK